MRQCRTYQAIQECHQEQGFPIEAACKLLHVARSAYHMLDNRYALLFIRGERPIMDLKYDIMKHPNLALTTDGGAPAYVHGQDTRSFARIIADEQLLEQAAAYEGAASNYELLSEEELEEYLNYMEEQQDEHQQET